MSSVKVNITAAELIKNMKVSAPVLYQLSEFWTKRIQGFTRAGKSLVTGSKLKPLSLKYQAFRRTYKGAKGELFKPNKSNLTFTGQMLASLKGYANYNTQTVRVTPTGSRTGGGKNTDIAEYVTEQGRPFLGLDEKGKKRMSQIILRDIRRNFKKRK